MDLGPLEIVVILAVVIMIFGVGKLPQVGSALGNSIREFRKASTGDEDVPQIGESEPAPPAIPSRDAYCTQCGIAVSPDVRFCTACGHSVTRATGS
jgi:sec-independent protein translocase protein TatA